MQRRNNLFSMAGWLFTDLLLVLAALFIATSSVASPPPPTPTPPPPRPVPGFALSVTPGARAVTQGEGASFAVAVTRTNGFADPVSLAVSALPGGAVVANPAAATGDTATLTVTTSRDTPAQVHTLTVTGTGGGLSRTATFLLAVQKPPEPSPPPPPVPGFALSVTPGARAVTQGEGASFAVAVTRTNGFADPVSLAVSALPGGAVVANPAAATGDTATLTVTTSRDTPAQVHTLTVTGTGGGLSRTATFLLAVQKPPEPSPTPPPCIAVLSPDVIAITLSIDSNGILAGSQAAENNLRNTFRAALAQELAARGPGQTYDTIQIGVILTFGASPQGNNSRGVEVARRVNAILLTEPPFDQAVTRDYLKFVGGSINSLNEVDFEVFLFVPQC